jgi:hypothetical protein
MIQDAEHGDSLAIGLEPEVKRLGRAEFQGLGEMPATFFDDGPPRLTGPQCTYLR